MKTDPIDVMCFSCSARIGVECDSKDNRPHKARRVSAKELDQLLREDEKLDSSGKGRYLSTHPHLFQHPDKPGLFCGVGDDHFGVCVFVPPEKLSRRALLHLVNYFMRACSG